MSDDLFKRDPANYRAMSVPLESREVADESWRLFMEGVSELRRKHKLRDVHVLVEMTIMEEGKELDVGAHAHLGAAHNALPMLAKFYGIERADHDHMIASIASTARRRKR